MDGSREGRKAEVQARLSWYGDEATQIRGEWVALGGGGHSIVRGAGTTSGERRERAVKVAGN